MITIAISKKQPTKQPEQKTKPTAGQTQTASEPLPSLSTRVYLINNPRSKVIAEASVNIGGAYAVHGFKVTDSPDGPFVSMPSRSYTAANGEVKYKETFHPITAEARQAILAAVYHAYEQTVSQTQTENAAEVMDSQRSEVMDSQSM